MSKPTLVALQHLRKLIGYLKGTGNLGVKLCNPTPGHGKWKVIEIPKGAWDFLWCGLGCKLQPSKVNIMLVFTFWMETICIPVRKHRKSITFNRFIDVWRPIYLQMLGVHAGHKIAAGSFRWQLVSRTTGCPSRRREGAPPSWKDFVGSVKGERRRGAAPTNF